LPAGGHIGEDIDLLISQAARCREILSRLANRDTQSDEMFARVKLSAMIADIVQPLTGPDIKVDISTGPLDDGRPRSADEPTFERNPAITYGLGNLAENAIDFARERVAISGRWSKSEISITVQDDGPGFSQDVFDRLGEPFVTTRAGYGPEPAEIESGSHEGMGLGFFIAKTLLERSGAAVALANRPAPGHGAIVSVTWPRARIELSQK
jgi:two-component system, sensor histidine kinase RegB